MAGLAGAAAAMVRDASQAGYVCEFELITGWGTQWPTAFTGFMLARWVPPHILVQLGLLDALDQFRRYLDEAQRGARWGFNGHTPVDNDSTAWALAFLSAVEGRRWIRAAGNWFEKAVNEDGGVSTYPLNSIPPDLVPDFGAWTTSTLTVTASAALAIRHHHGIAPHFLPNAEAYARSWLQHHGLSDLWWQGPWYPALVVSLGFPNLVHEVWRQLAPVVPQTLFDGLVRVFVARLAGANAGGWLENASCRIQTDRQSLRGGARMLLAHPRTGDASPQVYPDTHGVFEAVLLIVLLSGRGRASRRGG